MIAASLPGRPTTATDSVFEKVSYGDAVPLKGRAWTFQKYLLFPVRFNLARPRWCGNAKNRSNANAELDSKLLVPGQVTVCASRASMEMLSQQEPKILSFCKSPGEDLFGITLQIKTHLIRIDILHFILWRNKSMWFLTAATMQDYGLWISHILFFVERLKNAQAGGCGLG